MMTQLKRRCAPFGLLLVASACATQHEGIRPLRPLELATGPYSDVATAAFSGSLMYENGCLLFRDASSSRRILPVWPTGSVFNGTSLIFHEPGKPDQPLLVTQQFFMRGRPVTWSDLPWTNFAPFQHQCGGEPFLVSKVRPAN